MTYLWSIQCSAVIRVPPSPQGCLLLHCRGLPGAEAPTLGGSKLACSYTCTSSRHFAFITKVHETAHGGMYRTRTPLPVRVAHQSILEGFNMGCGFCAYNWRLPAYSGAFLLTVDNFSFFTCNWSIFAYSFSVFTYSWSFFAYGGKVRLIRALRDCKQRSLTVSKKSSNCK